MSKWGGVGKGGGTHVPLVANGADGAVFAVDRHHQPQLLLLVHDLDRAQVLLRGQGHRVSGFRVYGFCGGRYVDTRTQCLGYRVIRVYRV